VSCQRWEDGYYSTYRHLADEDLDFVLHLGDYLYEGDIAADGRFRRTTVPESARPAPRSLDQWTASIPTAAGLRLYRIVYLDRVGSRGLFWCPAPAQGLGRCRSRFAHFEATVTSSPWWCLEWRQDDGMHHGGGMRYKFRRTSLWTYAYVSGSRPGTVRDG